MAYPATTRSFADWLSQIDTRCVLIRNAAQQQHAFAEAGQLNMDMVRRFYDLLIDANVFFLSLVGITGLPEFLSDQKGGSVADPMAEFSAMRTQLIATLEWLRTNAPESTVGGTAYKNAFRFGPSNTTPSSTLTFSAGSTATYRTQLSALLATIS